MAKTGMTRPIDNLGRVVIPSEIRKNLGLETGDKLEIIVEKDATLKLKKFHVSCAFCGSENTRFQFHEKLLCEDCYLRIKRDKGVERCG